MPRLPTATQREAVGQETPKRLSPSLAPTSTCLDCHVAAASADESAAKSRAAVIVASTVVGRTIRISLRRFQPKMRKRIPPESARDLFGL
jgi:hypothetical protein